MKFLILGDIVGKPGRKIVAEQLPQIKKERQIDFVIANAENIAHGRGVNENSLLLMMESGVDFFTSGNHIFSNDGVSVLEKECYPIIRPANFDESLPGSGYKIVNHKSKKILLINLIGRVFMPQLVDCPFAKVSSIIESLEDMPDYIFVDFHAEATSEKYAMKHYLDGKVTAIYGTHTHVPTADLDLTAVGTAYITDLGMTGILRDSVLGVKKEIIMHRFKSQLPIKHELELLGSVTMTGVLLEMNKTMYAEKVEFISLFKK